MLHSHYLNKNKKKVFLAAGISETNNLMNTLVTVKWGEAVRTGGVKTCASTWTFKFGATSHSRVPMAAVISFIKRRWLGLLLCEGARWRETRWPHFGHDVEKIRWEDSSPQSEREDTLRRLVPSKWSQKWRQVERAFQLADRWQHFR